MASIHGQGNEEQVMINYANVAIKETEKALKELLDQSGSPGLRNPQQIKALIANLNVLDKEILNKRAEVEKVGVGRGKIPELTDLHLKIQKQITDLSKKLDLINLPRVTVGEIQSFLAPEDRARTAGVARAGVEFAGNNAEWKQMFVKEFGEQYFKKAVDGEIEKGIDPNQIDFKKLYKTHLDAVKSFAGPTLAIIKMLTGASIEVRYNRDISTIGDIKRLICVQTGRPIREWENINLVFAGRQCGDAQTADGLHLQDETTIHWVPYR